MEEIAILFGDDGQPAVVSRSTAEAIKWSARKYELIKRGKRADEAEAIIRQEMADAKGD